MEHYLQNSYGVLYNGDNKIVLTELQDESVDLMVTDPPYGLSDAKSDKDILKEAVRAFSDLVLPDLNEGNIQVAQYSEFVRILSQSTELRRSESRSVGIESWVGVPERAIDLNYDVKVRQIEITAGNIASSGNIPDGPLVDEVDPAEAEFIGDFVLDFGDAVNLASCDIPRGSLGEFASGLFSMPVSAICTSGSYAPQAGSSNLGRSADFLAHIRLCDNARGKSEAARSVLAVWRTEGQLMLRFDLTGRSGELTVAHRADEVDGLTTNHGPALIRTLAGASCLSSVFKSISVRFVISTADGTHHFYLHLWLPPTFTRILAQLGRTRKGFMGKEWDGQVAPVEIWRECFRVLKPGAFAFIMCAPRQDVSSTMIGNLKAAGFDVAFSPILWTYSTGFFKAHNIGKSVDKRLGAKREVVGKKPGTYADIKRDEETGQDGLHGGVARDRPRVECLITAPASPEAKVLDGSYTRFEPKPAFEYALVAQKPFTDKHRRSDVYSMLNGKYDYWYTQKTDVKDGKKGNIEQLTKRWEDELQSIGYTLNDGDVIERRLALNPELNDQVIVNRMPSRRLQERPYKNTDITSSITHALATGKGVTFLDDGKIPCQPGDRERERKNPHTVGHLGDHGIYGKSEPHLYSPDQRGRCAPNLLVSDDVLNDGKVRKLCKSTKPHEAYGDESILYDGDTDPAHQYDDSGSYSRYFSLDAWAVKHLPESVLRTFPFLIVPKPSRSEKNLGLDDRDPAQVNDGRKSSIDNPYQRGDTLRTNTHVTVKPLTLMAYLITIGSRPGDTIADPFSGSGTSLIAAALLKRKFIGIELDPEYCDITERRLWYYLQNRDQMDFDVLLNGRT